MKRVKAVRNSNVQGNALILNLLLKENKKEVCEWGGNISWWKIKNLKKML